RRYKWARDEWHRGGAGRADGGRRCAGDPTPPRGRDGCVRASARRRHARRHHAVRPRGLRRRGVAHRRSGFENPHARPRIRAGHLGTEGHRLESRAPGGLAEPDGQEAMRIETLADADAVARAAAAFTAAEARAAVAARGRFVVAVSGGHTPWKMLRLLADEEMPWSGVHVV